MVYAEDGGQKFKNYDANDSVKTPEEIERLKRLSIFRQRLLDRKNGKKVLGGEIGFNPGSKNTKKLETENSTEYYNRGITRAEIIDYNGVINDFSKVIELDP